MFNPTTVAKNTFITHVGSRCIRVLIFRYSLNYFPPKISHSVSFTQSEFELSQTHEAAVIRDF